MTDKQLNKMIFIVTTILCLIVAFCGVAVWFASSATIIFKLIVSILDISSGIAFEVLNLKIYRDLEK